MFYGHRSHVPKVAGAAAISAETIHVRYPGADEDTLHGIDVSIPVGSRCALIGHNGSGKSTLLKAAAGILPAHSGSLSIYGNPVGACHHRVAYLAQRSSIDWHFPLTVRDLVMTGRYGHLGWFARPRSKDNEMVDEVLERVQLAEFANRQIDELSGGQQQRALLGRALTQNADMLLLDEPMNALDHESQSIFHQIFMSLHEEGRTLVVATHDLDCIQEQFDVVLSMTKGRME
ncbi:MAG: ABC-type Mn2+/Zn2+ transport system ATPase subunit [Rhodothermales bacterium]|jgi:ABC-type Mn2+/Zn2+ transport system ATPase subunit